jgi:hypothetical protein
MTVSMSLVTLALCALAAPQEREAARLAEQDAVRLARAAVARSETVDAERLSLVGVEQVDWPDASLGCPRKDEMYAQVVTPGHRVELEGGGRRFDVRVSGRRAELCRGADEEPAPSRDTRYLQSVTRLSSETQRHLAARLGVAPSAVTVRFVRPTTWPDSRLGCPAVAGAPSPAPQPTRGFVIELTSQGRAYRYHADTSRFIACEDGATPRPSR